MIGKTISAGTFERPDRQLLGGIDSLMRQIMLKKSGSGISRRDFIKTTGAGALTAGLGPFPLFPERAQVVGEAAVQELKKQLRGELLRPGDGGYDAARRASSGRSARLKTRTSSLAYGERTRTLVSSPPWSTGSIQ
jgi:hypothetical protein